MFSTRSEKSVQGDRLSQVEAVSGERFGGRVKALRVEAGLTLEGLSEKSGVSRAMISKLERGEKSPTLVVVARISEGLGVNISRLVSDEEEASIRIIRREDSTVIHDPETGFVRRTLSPVIEARGVEFIENVIPEGGSSPIFPPHARGIVEYITVSEGELRATLDGSDYDLGPGDSIYFEADIEHGFRNTGDCECRYYLVIDPRPAPGR